MVLTLTADLGVARMASIVEISNVARFSILLSFMFIGPVFGLAVAVSFSGFAS